MYHLIIKYVSEEIIPEEGTADSRSILMFMVELRPLCGAPYPYRKPMNWFSHGYHGGIACGSVHKTTTMVESCKMAVIVTLAN